MLKNRSGAGQADGSRRLAWRGTCYGNSTRMPSQYADLP